MQKPLVGIAIPAIIVAGGVGLWQANSGGDNTAGPGPQRGNDSEQCVVVPVTTPTVEIVVANQRVRVPGASKPSVCVTYDTSVKGTPTITFYQNCGAVCAAVRVQNIDISVDLAVEVVYTLDGQENRVALNPDPVAVTALGQETCLAIYDPAERPSPCAVVITTPQNMAGSSTRAAETDLSWSASSEAGGRDVEITYEVWRSESPDPAMFSPIATVTDVSYVDTGLISKKTYYYFVIAGDAAGHRSAGSETVSVRVR